MAATLHALGQRLRQQLPGCTPQQLALAAEALSQLHGTASRVCRGLLCALEEEYASRLPDMFWDEHADARPGEAAVDAGPGRVCALCAARTPWPGPGGRVQFVITLGSW